MVKDDAYIVCLHELLDPLGKIPNKKMFGGHGIYCNGVIMGLVIDKTLYLKVDEQSCEFFSKEGCQSFVYQGKAEQVAMSYWSVPDEAMDSSEQMQPWAKLTYAAAKRKLAKAAPKKKR